MYCHACNREFDPHVRVCRSCRRPLIAKPISRKPLQAEVSTVEGLTSIDLTDVGLGDRDLLTMFLRSANIPFELHGDSLIIPPSRRDEALALIGRTNAQRSVMPTAPNEPLDPPNHYGAVDSASAPTSPATVASTIREIRVGRGDVAPRWRRWVGATIDGSLLGLVHRLTYELGGDWRLAMATSAVWYVVPTGIWGCTPGKLVIGTRVVDDEDPSWHVTWTASIVRWAVIGWAWLAVPLGSGALVTASLIILVIQIPILWDPERRGLHDRAAETLVIRAPSYRERSRC